MWKLLELGENDHPRYEFQKNLVVWKLFSSSFARLSSHLFQKNLVVWKHRTLRKKNVETMVSEELSSVETKHWLRNFNMPTGCFRRT
mgnify:CR=1 FL=1